MRSRWYTDRWRRGLRLGLIVGVLTFVAVVEICLVGKGWSGLAPGLAIGSAVGLVLGVGFGLKESLNTTPEERLTLGQDARRVIRDDWVSGVVAALIWTGMFGALGVVAGLGELATRQHLSTAERSLAIALGFGLFFGLMGLVFGVMVGMRSSVTALRHARASLVLALTRGLPARPTKFLEWGRNSGLLRVTGIAYQFRHDTYQRWLTAHSEVSVSATDAPVNPDVGGRATLVDRGPGRCTQPDGGL